MAERDELINSINCMAQVLTAAKDCFIQERAVKDEIINIASELLLADLRELRAVRTTRAALGAHRENGTKGETG